MQNITGVITLPCTVTKGVRINIPAEMFQVATGLPESEINVPSPSVENV